MIIEVGGGHMASEIDLQLIATSMHAIAGTSSAGASPELVSVPMRRKAAAEGKALQDGCLSGDTLVATRQGSRRIDSLVGDCDVLTDVGWIQASVESFGVQPLYAVTLLNGTTEQTVYATAGHRWLLSTGEWKLTRALVFG